MTIQGIKTNVQALLASTDYFVTVLDGPPDSDTDFAGYPAAAHYYVDTQSDYATVSQNRRVIQYVVELYIVPNHATPFKTMLTDEAYPLIDNVIQLFDQSIDLSSQSLSLSRACDIMRPAPGKLERVQQKEGTDGVMMTITLYCEADILVN